MDAPPFWHRSDLSGDDAGIGHQVDWRIDTDAEPLAERVQWAADGPGFDSMDQPCSTQRRKE